MKAFIRLIIRRCLIPALLVMLLISASAHAAEISALEGLEMARKGFAGMTDFTAEITQEKQIALLKKTMSIERPGPLPASRHILYGGLFAIREPSFAQG